MADSVLFPLSGDRVIDANGETVSGATLEFFEAGTDTPLTVYTDNDLGTPHSASIATTSGGLVPEIWLGTDDYKVTIKDSSGAIISGYPRDNRKGALSTSAFSTTYARMSSPVISVTDAAYNFSTDNKGKLHNCNTSSNTITFNLGSAVTAGDGATVAIRKTVAANSVVITAPSSQALSRSLTGLGEAIEYVSDGANWHIKSHTRALFDADVPYIKITDRRSSPPLSPISGQRYIVTSSPTGAWSSLSEHDVAEYHSSAGWVQYTPVTGWLAYVDDEELLAQYRGSAWVDLSNITAPDTSALKIAVFEDQKATNTSGGTPTASKWLKRTLNTSVSNTITDASLSSDRITLPAGTYAWHSSVPFFATGYTRTRVFQIKAEGTVSLPVASPGVATFVAHGLANGDQVIFSTTGTLPTGVTAGTSYFVINKTNDTFQVAATAGGTAINFTGSPSGTHSLVGGDDLALSPNTWVNNNGVGNNSEGTSVIDAAFTLSATAVLELQYYVGAGPSNGLGEPHNTTGFGERYSQVMITDLGSIQGPAGATGSSGADGLDGGTKWTYDSTTTMADPGTGEFRLNNATLASVTAMTISDLCGETGNPDLSAWVLTWDDSTNTIRGTITLIKRGTPGTRAVYNITGASTDNSGWTQLALTHVASSGSFSNGDSFLVHFTRAGNRGVAPTLMHWIPADRWTPYATGGCAAAATSSLGSELFPVRTIDFDSTADESAGYTWTPPPEYDLGTVTFRIYWTQTGSTGDVVFGLAGRAISDGAGWNAMGTEVTVTDTRLANNAAHITAASSAVTIDNIAANRPIALKLTRRATNVSDTLAADAKVIGVEVYYTAA